MLTQTSSLRALCWGAFIGLFVVCTTIGAQTTVGAASKSTLPSEPSGVGGQDAAPITILVFSDFESFLCARSAAVLSGLLAKSDDVRLVFKHTPAASNPNSMLAHEASLAAGAQGKFWEMHNLLFENQTRLDRADLLGYAKSLSLNLPAFRQALKQHTYRPVIEKDLVEASGLGVTSTPTFFINGRRLVGPQGPAVLQGFVDSVRDALPKNPEGVARVASSGPAAAIHLEHAPAKGPLSAPISFVEFSDFECSYCSEVLPIVNQLLHAYPTQIRYSFKHFPLESHKNAFLAHEAALAAKEQGKFWEMHDLLFATQDKLTRADLIAKAQQLNLDTLRFTRDLDSHRFQPTVEADRQEGNHLGVDGTPYCFINGHAVSGGASLADFKKLIDAALKEAPNHTPMAQ